MRRIQRIGAGVFLALLLVTCTDKNVTGPTRYGSAALDLRAFEAGPQPGMPDIPLDSVRVILRRLPGLDSAAGQVFHLQSDTLAADSFRVDLSVSLKTDPESFQITVSAYGGNKVWYVASDTTSISSGGQLPARLTAKYVGPGAGATSVTLAPVDTTVTGGQAIALRVTVDSGATLLDSVPVGIRSSDTTKGKVSQPSFTTGVFTGKSGIRDSVWLVVETPTHLKDSTRIHIVPPPSQLVKISGDSQTVIVNGTTAVPLAVRVEDALNGGSPNVPVTWTVTQGTATLAPPSPVTSDTGGYARVSVTPTSLGTVKVQASSAGLTGSPITFTVNILAGIVHQVIVAPKLDTLAKGLTLQFSATLKDSLGNVISSVKPVWTSSNVAVATVDTTGLATALAGDSTYIVASAGGYADTARLFVRAPAKVVLTPADTVITSIGDSVHLTGIVLTNFGDTVKTATVLRFASTVPSVVTVNATTGEATLVGAGNGVVQATDTISKVTGTATLRVNQKVFSILNAPADSIEVGVSGQAQILAAAKDKNGHPIPGKTFGWVTRNAGVATVNQAGVVTGVAIAQTYAVDTLVDSVTVFRDSTLVSVVAAPPPVMRWAFDTLAIGNGGNTTVNVSMNVPSAAGTVMQIISLDTTKVKPTQTRFAIGTGGANASVTLQGLSATLTPVDVIAQDSAGIYKPDTLRVIVVSTIFFAQVNQTTRTQDFYLNQNEPLTGQVFLSDAAPAGGLGVTFVFGKGFTSTNPATVVIPAGRLAASVQFVGIGVGTDSVTPSSGAFAGKFSYLHVAKDTFQIGQPYPYTGTVGLGQTEQPYAQITYGMDHILPFSIALTPALGTVVPNPDTILVNQTSRYFTVTGTSLGTGTITVSASNWLSTTAPFIVTTPQLVIGGTTSMVAGTPTLGYWYAVASDSLRYGHAVSATLMTHIVSRDTSVVKILVDSGPILAGTPSNSIGSSVFAQPSAGGDSTWLVVTAPGYKPDSQLIHVTKPTMTAAYNYPTYDGRVALNTTFPQPVYVQIPYARTDTFAVVLHHTNKAGPQAPDTIFIPKGQVTGYLTSITGVSLGTDTVTIDTVATKPGYVLPAGVVWILRVDSLHVRPYSYATSLVTISAPSALQVEALEAVDQYARPLNSPLTVTLALSRPNVVTLDSSTVIIPAGSAYSTYDTERVAVGVNAPDSTRILTTAPGSTPDSGNVIRVTPTPLSIQLGYSGLMGRGLHTGASNTVTLPAAAPNTLTVVLSHAVTGKDSVVPAIVTIPKGATYSTYFDLRGVDSTGSDTLIASATGFVSGRATVNLYRDTLEIAKPGASQLTTAPPYRLFTGVYNKVGYNQSPSDSLVYTVTSSNPLVVAIDSGAHVNAAEDTVTAVVDSQHFGGVVRINFVGPGTAYLKATAPGFGADSFQVSVTGPSLNFSPTSTTTGVGQMTFEQVAVQNPVTGSPLVITLQRSDSQPVGGASNAFNFSPVTLTIPVGSTLSNVDTIVGDTIGTAQLIARATSYGQSTAIIQVGKPQLIATSSVALSVGAAPSGVSVFAADQTNNTRYVSAPLTVTATVSDPTVAMVDSATRQILAGSYNTASTFKFSGLKKGAVQAYFTAPGYKADTMLITVDTAAMSITAPTSVAVGLQETGNINLPFYAVTPVTVTLSSTNPSALAVPAQVIVPANNYYVSFTMQGVGVGSAQINAVATGFKDAPPAGVVVTPARLVLQPFGSPLAGQPMNVQILAEDTLGSYHPVINPASVTLGSSAGAHASFPANPITLPAGSYQVVTPVTFDTAGTYNVTASATGFESGTSSGISVSGVAIKVGVGNGLTFTPGTDTVPVNSYVTWVWDATNTNSHGVHWMSAPPSSLPTDSPTQSSGIYQWYFSTPGTYTYQCSVHGALMSGTIVVQ